MEREQGRTAWSDGMRVERVAIGHVVGELDSGPSRRRDAACIGDSGTSCGEPIGGVYGGQRGGECGGAGQRWGRGGRGGHGCWRGMEAVLDVGGGEGGADGMREVGVDVGDGGHLLTVPIVVCL